MSTYNIGYCSTIPSNKNFFLHNHDNYEIVYFLSGDTNFIVEGAVYPMRPNDIIMMRPQEMHRAFHNSNVCYSRIVANIEKDFFVEEKCEQYQNVFMNRNAGTRNLISSTNLDAGVPDLFERIKRYTNNFKNFDIPVMRGLIIELLHILNKTEADGPPSHNTVQKVIAYINANYKNDISLSSIASQFYISKPYLSKLFRENTGYTVGKYVNHKRINSVCEYIKAGENLGNACIKSGFNEYSSFYRAFYKEHGENPRLWLQKNLKK